MNQVQRKFLLERIQKKVQEKITELERSKKSPPHASNYIFKAIMNDTLELRTTEQIKESLKRKALNCKEGVNWLSEEKEYYSTSQNIIKIQLDSLIVVPPDYAIERDKALEHNASIAEQVAQLKLQMDTLEVRIQLASDKTLANLINEVDDMGDLSLIDTKIKLLN